MPWPAASGRETRRGRDQDTTCPPGYGQLTSSSRAALDNRNHQSLCCLLPIPFDTALSQPQALSLHPA